MKSWIKRALKSRAEFYKKHPEKEKARIEKIRKKCKSAKERKEMSIKMKQVYKGKDTQKQVFLYSHVCLPYIFYSSSMDKQPDRGCRT